MDLEMKIVTAHPDFNFKTISLGDPQPLTGSAGFYFTQLGVGEENKPLCLQLPECLTKQGVVDIKNGKYLDLMFERTKNDDLMRWIEQLEYTCQDIIDSKKNIWFQSELTRDDIESMMTQVTRLYQSGKYMLIRAFIETNKTGSKCIAYDENEIGFDLDTLEANKPVIPLIMLEGVKFSSRSFEISLKVVQVMVMGQTVKKSTCLIKRQQDLALLKATSAEPSIIEAPVAPSVPALVPALVPAPSVPAPSAPSSVPSSVPSLVPALVPVAIEEVTIDYATVENDSISLKNPNDVYYELYKKAREKAKQCRVAAIEAYLEAKQIKTKYMLFDEDDDDSDDISDDDDEEEEEEEEEEEN
jgi:hypothetical protein